MSKEPRPEVSQTNPYWIERHRYYELKHFCLQYPLWIKARATIDGMPGGRRFEYALYSQTGSMSDPTATAADARLYYTDRIEMLAHVARDVDPIIGNYILQGVTSGVSYDILRVRSVVPCGKDLYYDLYRKFFWLLSKARK